MHITLLTAVRTTMLADSDPVRRALFARLRATSTAVRLACWLHAHLPGPLSSLLVSSYGVKSWLTIRRPDKAPCDLLAVGVHANARRRISDIAATYDPNRVRVLRTKTSVLLRPATITRLAQLAVSRQTRRAFRLIDRINRRGDFLVSCRVASVIGCYAASRQALTAAPVGGVLVSSDSNPEEVGLVAAARSRSLPSVFVSHAYTTSVSPQLNFSLSILEGEAAVDAYSRKGPIRGRVFLGGVEGQSTPMDPSRLKRARPAIGIFAPKVIVWPVFAEMIDDCRRHFQARAIVIRWHPSMLEDPALRTHLDDVSGIVETAATDSLASVAARCDWIVANASSNVHLQVLKMGIPTVAIRQIGVTSEDLYGFVANRVVLPPVAALRQLSPDDAMSFYGQDWIARFRRYDAAYLKPESEVMAELRQALQNLLSERPISHAAPA
jgi:hypothetical protein